MATRVGVLWYINQFLMCYYWSKHVLSCRKVFLLSVILSVSYMLYWSKIVETADDGSDTDGSSLTADSDDEADQHLITAANSDVAFLNEKRVRLAKDLLWYYPPPLSFQFIKFIVEILLFVIVVSSKCNYFTFNTTMLKIL